MDKKVTDKFTSRRRFPILRMMVNKGYIPVEKVRDNPLVRDSTDFTEVLINLIKAKIIDEDKVKEFFVDFLNAEPYEKTNKPAELDKGMIELIPYNFMSRKMFFPLSFEDGVLKVVALNPYDIDIIQQLKFLGIQNIKMYVGTYSEIEQALEKISTSELTEAIENIDDEARVEEEIQGEEEINIQEAIVEAKEAPIVKASRVIILNGVKMGASDIHIEPFEKEVKVRYRVDGILRTYQKLPVSVKEAIVARYKIMSNLDIAEKRLPQDGRIRVKIDGKPIDLRVSILPTVYGEKIVMRIQDADSYLNLKLEDLGFEPDDLEKVRTQIYRPWGMVLVTGPTGSGKTTTLYTVLMERNTDDVNIETAEDPVEVSIPGINQVQVKESIGLTFAEALRSFLRQDPDIILVGEIRDRETAEIAVKAALTGHLVFSTLHTNDAPSSITRLVNIGVDKFLVATAVNLIIAQRLIRRLCKHCRQPAEFPEEFWEGIGFTKEDIREATFYNHNPSGCEKCNHTGYKGRTAVHEILELDDEIRQIILKTANDQEIRDYARKKGIRNLYENALLKIKRGITDIAEVERVLVKE